MAMWNSMAGMAMTSPTPLRPAMMSVPAAATDVQIVPNRVSPWARYLSPQAVLPSIDPTATVRRSQITGDVRVGPYAHIVNAVIRADEGTPFYIGARANVQDFAVLHAHSTQEAGTPVMENLVSVPGQGHFAIYIGDGSSLAHGALVHGPSYIGQNSFVSFKATIDHARIGNNVEIGAHAYIKDVTIPDNTAIAPGAVITQPEDIARFTVPRKNLNPKISHINTELAMAYHSGFQRLG